MNRILYETSCIGNPKCFFTHLIASIWIFGVLAVVYILKVKRMKEEHNSQYVFCVIVMFVMGFSEILDVCRLISKYQEIVLGYKRGMYSEVEGIVEDYTDYSHRHTFTVENVEFAVSGDIYTWEYTYWTGKNVITGDGQHLKIRYIPVASGANSIVYIEEIVDE